VRDLLRARLQLVTRERRCRHTLGSLLERYNVPTPAELPELARLQAALQAEQRVLLREQIRRVEAELRGRLLPAPDGQRLVWVPGIGKLVAYTLVLEIDDIRRFPTVRHFHSYSRLVPGADNSAGKSRHKRSKEGNRYLKLAFHHAAVRAIQYFPETSPRFARSTAGSCAGRASRSRARSSPRSWRRSSTRCSPRESRSMAPSADPF
jgi:transposase